MSRKRKIGICFLLSIFLLLTILLFSNNISFFDDKIYSIVISFKSDFLTTINKIITFLCSVTFIIISTIILLIVINDYKVKQLFISNLVGGVLLNQVLKRIIRRARPIGIALIKEKGFSFPSGHSMISMIFYGTIIYLIMNSKIKKERKVLFITLLSLIILFIGLSRIYLGVHYASDVLAGFCLSAAFLLFSTYLYETIE